MSGRVPVPSHSGGADRASISGHAVPSGPVTLPPRIMGDRGEQSCRAEGRESHCGTTPKGNGGLAVNESPPRRAPPPRSGSGERLIGRCQPHCSRSAGTLLHNRNHGRK